MCNYDINYRMFPLWINFLRKNIIFHQSSKINAPQNPVSQNIIDIVIKSVP